MKVPHLIRFQVNRIWTGGQIISKIEKMPVSIWNRIRGRITINKDLAISSPKEANCMDQAFLVALSKIELERVKAKLKFISLLLEFKLYYKQL